MKIVSHYLNSIDGVEIFPIISLIIFLLFFTVMLIWVLRINKNEAKQMSQLPLQDNDKNDIDKIKN